MRYWCLSKCINEFIVCVHFNITNILFKQTDIIKCGWYNTSIMLLNIVYLLLCITHIQLLHIGVHRTQLDDIHIAIIVSWIACLINNGICICNIRLREDNYSIRKSCTNAQTHFSSTLLIILYQLFIMRNALNGVSVCDNDSIYICFLFYQNNCTFTLQSEKKYTITIFTSYKFILS